jgi:3-oxoacyl-[acyl-carrier protein] reductase
VSRSAALADQDVQANTVSPGNTFFPGGVWPSNAVVFLSSSAASLINRTNLVVELR